MSDRKFTRELRSDVAQDMAAAGQNWMAGGALIEVVEALFKEGSVTGAQVVAVSKLLNDMRAAYGSSAGLVTSVADRVSGGGVNRMFLTSCGDAYAFDRMESTLHAMQAHERRTLAFLITHKEKARGSLIDFGREHSTYETAKTRRAWAVGRISGALESIRENYPERS